MKIPKEYGEKARRYAELKKESETLFKEVADWLKENTEADAVYINDLFVTREPTGHLQEDDEYCDQWCQGWAEDAFAGRYYHQIEGTDEYVGYTYET